MSELQPLRQGDILLIEESVTPRAFSQYGVVINADCDLAHCKNDDVVAFVPMYSLSQYLQQYWVSSFLSQERASIIRWAGDSLNLSATELSDLQDWVVDGDPENIARQLIVNLSIQRGQAALIAAKLRQLKHCSGQPTIASVSNLAKEQNQPKRYLMDKLNQAKKNMGDGHLFISELAGQADLGYVIRLRRVYSIDASRCFLSERGKLLKSDGEGASALRIARLTPRYQYRTAQLFAMQFSRIGLPDEIMALSELALESLAQSLIGES